MNDRNDLPSIHECITAVLAELGLADAICHRTGILIRNGFCQGRQFFYAGARVVWLLESALLEFYDEQGQLLRQVALDHPVAAERAAA